MFLLLLVTVFVLSGRAFSVTVSGTPAQTFAGVGGSSAWWPNDLINFPETVRQNLSDLLWSQSGLGLSSYRWNLGGGGIGVSDLTRAIDTFYVSQGQYNWSADPGGVYFVKAASMRQVPTITAFVNSPPSTMTSNAASCGGTFKNGSESAYGKYLADIVTHFKTSEGVNVNYLSIMNEPDNSFGPQPCGQEGCIFNANQRAAVINGVYNNLQIAGLGSVGIMADESSSLISARLEYPTWLLQALNQVSVISHHTYDFPTDSFYASYVQYVQSLAPSKRTWMSEVCCSVGMADASDAKYSAGYDPTIRGGLHFSSLMLKSFIVANESHYDFWTLVSKEIGCSPLNNVTCVQSINSAGWNDGLIYYDSDYAMNGNHALYLTKHYWTMKHFGNFVKPGSVRYPVSDGGNDVLAVTYESGMAILVLNPSTSNNTIPLTLTLNSTVLRPSAAYRTSATEDFITLGSLPAQNPNGSWALGLMGMSLTTWIFSHT